VFYFFYFIILATTRSNRYLFLFLQIRQINNESDVLSIERYINTYLPYPYWRSDPIRTCQVLNDIINRPIHSTVSINPSLYCVVPDLLLSLSLSLCVLWILFVLFFFLLLWCIYLSASLLCRWILFVFLFFLPLRPYLSIHIFIVLYRIFPSIFMCRFDPFLVCVLLGSIVSICPSLNRVVPDLFVSL
jgi:hypothetical protein